MKGKKKLPVHEPGCAGAYVCGGWYRCRCCGKRCGWCRGDSVDESCCPECWDAAGGSTPEFRFDRLERRITRRFNGRWISEEA